MEVVPKAQNLEQLFPNTPVTVQMYHGNKITWGKFLENAPKPNDLPSNGELPRQDCE